MNIPTFGVIEDTTEKAWLEEWNRIHIGLVYFRNNFMADYCEEMIGIAKTAYYNSGDVIMVDEAYDRLENNLKTLRPNSSMLEVVGAIEEIDEDDI